MKFQLDNLGELSLVSDVINKVNVDETENLRDTLESKAVSVNWVNNENRIWNKLGREVRNDFKGKGLRSYSLAITPLVLLTAGATEVAGAGIFWDTFMKHIFPYFIDVAKVFCIIKIAQGFYSENRGGRDGGTGMGSLITYSKWYLCFLLLPVFVTLVDQIGHTMLQEIKING